MTKLYFVLAACSITACAHIPGTDVPIPAERHEGYDLAICMPSSKDRNEACCGYSKPGQVRVICTEDGGGAWVVEAQPETESPESFGETL